MRDLPRVTTLDLPAFPIERDEVGGYAVLRLPEPVRAAFDAGANIVRINSAELAETIPNFGGKTSGEDHSLCFHQDHLNPADDPRRFLMLTKHHERVRGSSTLAVMPSVAKRILAIEERHFKDARLRALTGRERRYDPRFLISEAEYDRCFDSEDGYEDAVAAFAARHKQPADDLSVRLGILGYLIRGAYADRLVRETVQSVADEVFAETWTESGMLIIDNPAVFHARLGGNVPPLQRNFCV
jgi:hypothetical protein